MTRKGHVVLGGLKNMEQRLNARGGGRQQDRMIEDKLWSLKHAIKYSYQGAKVKLVEATEDARPCPALINPDKTKQNYDDKIISIPYDFGYKAGDVFDWCNTNTKWLIYLQDLTELAYFRAEIRRCRYCINFAEEDGTVHTVYAAVRGPVETSIQSIQKNKVSVDTPNWSLDILIPKNEYTIKYFKRYAKFYMKGFDDLDTLICWRVEAVDSISMRGIIQISAQEYYINKDQDDVEERVVDGLILEPIEEEPSYIKGPESVKPKQAVTYTFVGARQGHWSWDKTSPIDVQVHGREATITWLKNFSGSFTIKCGDAERTIMVESLF